MALGFGFGFGFGIGVGHGEVRVVGFDTRERTPAHQGLHDGR